MLDLSELEFAATFWDWVSYIGLIVAFLAAFSEFITSWTTWISVEWKPRIEKTSALLVLLGAAVSLIASWQLSNINGRIVAALKKETATAQISAGNAMTSAANAETRLEEAKARTANVEKAVAEAQAQARKFEAEIASSSARAEEAKRLAERERLERVKIEERLAWRSLAAVDQQQRLVSKLKTFAGIPFTIRVFQEPEALRLLNQIVEILHSASWAQKPIVAAMEVSTKYGAAGISVDSGIIIRVDQRRAHEFGAAGKALAAALADERLASEFAITTLQFQPEVIHIAIGKKP